MRLTGRGVGFIDRTLALGEALEAEVVEHSVRFLDTTRAFAEAPDFQSLYYLTDGHPRPAGHVASRVVSSP